MNIDTHMETECMFLQTWLNRLVQFRIDTELNIWRIKYLQNAIR